jgi:hypothetical protein
MFKCGHVEQAGVALAVMHWRLTHPGIATLADPLYGKP